MSKDRLTKKEIENLQHNEVEDALVGAQMYVSSHRGQLAKWSAIGAGALGVVGLVALGITLRTSRLDGRLSQALAVYSAPLLTEPQAVAPGAKVYKDEAERAAEAKKQLEALASDSPSSRAGRAAATILLSLDSKAPTPAALDAVKAFASSESGSIAAGVAAVSLLEAKAASGQAKEAIEIGKKYLDATTPPAPKDVLMFTLAKIYEKTGQKAEAKSQYQRVVSDFPESSLRTDAQQRLDSLG